MATEAIQQCITVLASVDLSHYPSDGTSPTTGQFRFVKSNRSTDAYGHDVTSIAAATDLPLGVLQDNPKQGDEGRVCVFGVTKCVVGTGGITAGDELTIDAHGAVVTATRPTLSVSSGALDSTGGSAINQFIVGRALYTHAAGDVGTILVTVPTEMNP